MEMQIFKRMDRTCTQESSVAREGYCQSRYRGDIAQVMRCGRTRCRTKLRLAQPAKPAVTVDAKLQILLQSVVAARSDVKEMSQHLECWRASLLTTRQEKVLEGDLIKLSDPAEIGACCRRRGGFCGGAGMCPARTCQAYRRQSM